MNDLPEILKTVSKLNLSLASKEISRAEHCAAVDAIKAKVVSNILASYEEVLDRPLVLKPEDFGNGLVAFEDQSSIPLAIMKNISDEIIRFCAPFNPQLTIRTIFGLGPKVEDMNFDFLRTMVRKHADSQPPSPKQSLGDLVVNGDWISPYSAKHPKNQGKSPGIALANAVALSRPKNAMGGDGGVF